MAKFAKELSSLIERRLDGRPQKWLADRSGLTPASISRYSNGQSEPGLEEIIALAKGFGITPSELIGEITGGASESLELRRLKRLATSIPGEFFDHWPKLSPGRKAACLFVLTGDRRFVPALSDATLKQIESLLQSLEQVANQTPE